MLFCLHQEEEGQSRSGLGVKEVAGDPGTDPGHTFSRPSTPGGTHPSTERCLQLQFRAGETCVRRLMSRCQKEVAKSLGQILEELPDGSWATTKHLLRVNAAVPFSGDCAVGYGTSGSCAMLFKVSP